MRMEVPELSELEKRTVVVEMTNFQCIDKLGIYCKVRSTFSRLALKGSIARQTI